MNNKNTIHPIIQVEPQNMSILEQITSMIYLAQSHSLEELRAKQDLVDQQIHTAHQHNLDVNNLLAMQDNLSAAVAYQSYPAHNIWMSFIRLE
jgi:hypothetical protein